VLKSLRARNTALLVGIVLVGQLLAALLLYVLAIRPQVERAADIMARNIAAVSLAMDAIPDDERAELIATINAGRAVRILPGNQQPPEDRTVPTLLERMFMRSFAREMGKGDIVVWQGGQIGQLWVRVNMGGRPYWISYERPKGWTPNGALAAAFLIAVTMALIAGLLIQRRIAAPLRNLAAAADATDQAQLPARLPVDGPTELAVVAGSFNAMRDRLALQSNRRTQMLAAISHDLRTPLAKIRLELAMIPGIKPDSEALIVRQLERLDAMLSQFLDFGRGIENEVAVQTDLAALLQDVVDDFGLDLTIDPPVERVALLRPLAVKRAISNILRNGEIYGAPPIEASLCQEGRMLVITIRDHGKGVSEADLAHLLEPFFRSDSARGMTGGSGLGFAIANETAIAHGGALGIRNAPDGGLLVEMTIPAAH
jgi:two-component system, OmpR family, osmolarity sensor histidine kinase EnvZ